MIEYLHFNRSSKGDGTTKRKGITDHFCYVGGIGINQVVDVLSHLVEYRNLMGILCIFP